MDKVTIYLESDVHHVSQILTGFLLLKKQGLSVELVDRRGSGSPYCGMPMIRAEYRGQRLLYDMGDGYNVPEDMELALKECDVYFKRSFSEEKNHRFLPDYTEKMYPLGLYYRVTCRENPLNEPVWKHLLKSLAGRAPERYFTPAVFEGTPRRSEEKPPKILFLTQLWNDQEPDFSEADNAERTYINETRIAIIRKLKERYGDAFLGGLNDNALSRAWAPDLILPKQYTERKRYLKLVQDSDICIGSMGLFESIGGKTAEYVAAAKGIVNERLHYSVPGEFVEGKNYLAFETVEQCLDAVDQLVNDPEKLYAMKQANEGYYRNYMKPDVLVANSLKRVDEILEKQAQFAK